jgi:hypothetical protein
MYHALMPSNEGLKSVVVAVQAPGYPALVVNNGGHLLMFTGMTIASEKSFEEN